MLRLLNLHGPGFVGVILITLIWSDRNEVMGIIVLSALVTVLLDYMLDKLNLERMRRMHERLTQISCYMLYSPIGWGATAIIITLVLHFLPRYTGVIICTMYVVVATGCLLVSMKLDQLFKRRVFTI